MICKVLNIGSPQSLYAGDDNGKETKSNPAPGVIAQYVFDDRDFNSLAVYVSTTRFPFGFTIWGFTELNGAQQDPAHRFDLTRAFSEYRFSHSGLGNLLNISGLIAQIEYTDIGPQAGELLRFGIAYRHKLNIPSAGGLGGMTGWLQWRAHPVETDGDGGQASLIYFIPLHKNAHINGWLDINYSDEESPKWVFGPFLNLKIGDRSWFVLRYRHNGFEEASPFLDGTGFALGIRVDF